LTVERLDRETQEDGGHHEGLLDGLDIQRFGIYIQDYGAPVGTRVAARRPEAIQAVIASGRRFNPQARQPESTARPACRTVSRSASAAAPWSSRGFVGRLDAVQQDRSVPDLDQRSGSGE
jgi:pimeloyl-ACP methyl ester carboxylesterase